MGEILYKDSDIHSKVKSSWVILYDWSHLEFINWSRQIIRHGNIITINLVYMHLKIIETWASVQREERQCVDERIVIIVSFPIR